MDKKKVEKLMNIDKFLSNINPKIQEDYYINNFKNYKFPNESFKSKKTEKMIYKKPK